MKLSICLSVRLSVCLSPEMPTQNAVFSSILELHVYVFLYYLLLCLPLVNKGDH